MEFLQYPQLAAPLFCDNKAAFHAMVGDSLWALQEICQEHHLTLSVTV